jgi:GR25 family glycosyltransferase involved in LPS biosynthesis
MKMYVITIKENERSVQVADRCVKSGLVFGYKINKHKAYTPENCDVYEELKKLKYPSAAFNEIYSRPENCIAGFLSHHSLWKKCVRSKEPIVIFEHDAVLVGDIPQMMMFDILNLGKPSYGKFNTPSFIGYGSLVSKPYFPGAHAYRLTPKGAQQLIDECVFSAGPTDIYIHSSKFTLGEYYPWPAEARDSFTTIQQKQGCYAKHNYGETYEII